MQIDQVHLNGQISGAGNRSFGKKLGYMSGKEVCELDEGNCEEVYKIYLFDGPSVYGCLKTLSRAQACMVF